MKKLESMGFSWELHMDWESRMQQLRVFKAKYGHCNVPQQIKINGKGRVGTCSLGTWVTMYVSIPLYLSLSLEALASPCLLLPLRSPLPTCVLLPAIA